LSATKRPLKKVAFGPHAPFNLRNRSLEKENWVADPLQSTWKINVFFSNKEFLWAIAAGKKRVRMAEIHL